MKTEKQLNRLYAIARGARWVRTEVLDWMWADLGHREPACLTLKQYDKLCNLILENPKHKTAPAPAAAEKEG